VDDSANCEVITEFKRKERQKVEDERNRPIELYVVTLIRRDSGVDFAIFP